jgi:hypothetical protein
MDSDAPYRHVYHAVRRAYGGEIAEAWGRVASAGCFGRGRDDDNVRRDMEKSIQSDTVHGFRAYIGGERSIRGFSLKRERKRASDWSPYDAIIQDAWTMKLIRRVLPEWLMVTLDAKFIIAIEPDPRRRQEPAYWGEARQYNLQLSRKRAACHRLAALLSKAATYGPPNRAYTLDRVMHWSGLGRCIDDEWAATLGKDVRTLRRWRRGRGVFAPGIECTLRDWLAEAHEALAEPMHEAGLTVVRLGGPNRYTVSMNSNKASA